MAKLSAVEFVKVFAPLAKAGKSAYEIGQALGLEGDEDKVSQAVSVKASQLRKRLKESAESAAKAQGLDKDATDALVAAMGAKLPRIRSKGRASEVSELVSAIDAALAAINPPADPPADPAVEAPVVDAEAEAPVIEAEVEAPKRSRKRGLLG